MQSPRCFAKGMQSYSWNTQEGLANSARNEGLEDAGRMCS